MSAGKYTLSIEQGATFLLTITKKDSSGTAENLTGYTARGQIRKRYDSSATPISFTCAILDQVTNTGKFTIGLTATQTAAIPVDKSASELRTVTKYIYDVELVSGSTVYRIIEGTAEVSPEVTR